MSCVGSVTRTTRLSNASLSSESITLQGRKSYDKQKLWKGYENNSECRSLVPISIADTYTCLQ